MTNSFEINQRSFPKDKGEIVLYQRSDHKNPKWQTRIKIRGSKGYERQSTKTSNFDEAFLIATRKYEDLVDHFEATGSTKIRTFQETVDEWLESSSKNPSVLKEAKERLYNYPVRFWANTAIDEITDIDLDNFIEWRESSGIHKQRSSRATIKRDLVPLKQVFKYAYKKKYITKRLTFESVKTHSKRRPEFTEKEWKQVVQKLPEWVDKAKKNKRHYRDRFYLKQYVLILGNTGIRPGTEARSLTWESFEHVRFPNKEREQLIIRILKGKTGPRIVVPDKNFWRYLNDLEKFRATELEKSDQGIDETEPIFCHENGDVINTFATGFRAFLKHYGLLSNSEGVERAPYSMRHTYATRMIRSGKNHWFLAKNMGTSVELLEKYYVHDDPTQYGKDFIDFQPPEYEHTLAALLYPSETSE